MNPKDLFELVKATGRVWYEHEAYRLGAALAYYMAFSLAPVLIIVVAMASLVFGERAAQGQLVEQIGTTVGPQMAQTIQDILRQTHTAGSGTLATVFALAVLLFGATAVFAELKNALDAIWDVRPKPGRGWLRVVKDRFWSFTVVLGIGLLLLVSLSASTVLDKFVSFASLPGSIYWWQAVEVIVSLGLLTLLFAMIYKTLPDVLLSWRDVWVGAAVTAVLFTLGKYLIGLYLGHIGLTSAYGVAGALAVILLWVYYSSQVLLFGAAFTQVYANKYGRPLVRADRAEPRHPGDLGFATTEDSDPQANSGWPQGRIARNCEKSSPR